MPQCANTLNAPCAQVEVADKPGDLMRTMKVWTTLTLALALTLALSLTLTRTLTRTLTLT